MAKGTGLLAWLRRRIRGDRRWITDPAERDAHDARVRSRLFGSQPGDSGRRRQDQASTPEE